MHLKHVAYFFISAISVVVILIYGKGLLIPFLFALILWFLARQIKSLMDKVNFIKRRFPGWLKSLFTFLLMLTVLGFVSKVITGSIESLARSHKQYESNVDVLLQQLNQAFNVDLVQIIKTQSVDFDFSKILGEIFSSLTDILSSAFMIVIYALFIFLEEAYFHTKLRKVSSEEHRYTRIAGILEQIEASVAKYLGLKTLVSMITGVLSYVVLAIIGIDSPVFWAFLIFILNFIPTIGSLIATLFPAVFCLLQFGEIMPGIYVLAFVGAVQVLVGNVLEPRLMGNSMNVSPLVAIISLSFWGALWGVTGMIISVPITVILILICSHFPPTRSVAVLLSEKGEIH